MDYTPQPYAGPQDLAHLDAILIAGHRACNEMYYVHPGDLRWWLYYTFPGEERWSDIYLWEDRQGRVVAWTLFAGWEQAIDLFHLPELHGTPAMQAMLAWGVERILPRLRRAGVAVLKKDWIYPQDRAQIAALEALGFSRGEAASVDMRRSLGQALPVPALPPGFRLRPSRGLADLESRALAQRSAFASDLPLDRYLDRFHHYMASPVYNPERDIVVAAPDGRIAAFAQVWADPALQIGHFEPVGVHAEFQRRGLGRAVMLAGLRVLQSLGMRTATVTTGEDNTPAVRLYEDVGFRIRSQVLIYERRLDL